MVFSWFQGKCFLGAYTRELGPLNGINKLCQVTFQGYSNRFFFFFSFLSPSRGDAEERGILFKQCERELGPGHPNHCYFL